MRERTLFLEVAVSARFDDTADTISDALAMGADVGRAYPVSRRELVGFLRIAAARVEQANREGSSILSAWLPDALALLKEIDKAEARDA